MPLLHRNSQKRIYFPHAIYFVTTVTNNRYPFFENHKNCQIFIDVLNYCQSIKPFILHGYKINPDHVHLLIEPQKPFNISQIIHNLKRVSAYQMNHECVDFVHEGEDIYPRLQMDRRRFVWQKSYHDHYIRDKNDYLKHQTYIKNQWIKHGLSKNEWCYLLK